MGINGVCKQLSAREVLPTTALRFEAWRRDVSGDWVHSRTFPPCLGKVSQPNRARIRTLLPSQAPNALLLGALKLRSFSLEQTPLTE